MGMVSLPDKSLAEAFSGADYLLVVRQREDGKNEVYRATPEQVAKVVGDSLGIPGWAKEPLPDKTLEKEGSAADAAATGEKIKALEKRPFFYYDEEERLTFDDGQED